MSAPDLPVLRGHRPRRRGDHRVRQLVARLLADRVRVKRGGFFVLAAAMCFTSGPLLRYCREHRYFSVRAVEVRGLGRLEAARVRKWLGMAEGSSIWSASPGTLEARLEGLPAIARARVQRILPDRIVVTVREREPRAVLRLAAGSFFVDRAGIVIDDASLGEGELPILSVAESSPDASWALCDADDGVRSRGEAFPGSSADALPATRDLRQAILVARLIESGAAGIAVSELALEPAHGDAVHPALVAYSSDGRLSIRLGWGNWRQKLDSVRRVLAHAAKAGDGPIPVGHLAGTLDVRDPENVVVRWQPAGVAA